MQTAQARILTPLDRHQRILSALQKCSTHYGDQTKPILHTAVRNMILPFTEGRTIIDLGCGKSFIKKLCSKKFEDSRHRKRSSLKKYPSQIRK